MSSTETAVLGAPPPGRLDVVGLGENSLDHVAELEHWPGRGGKARLAGYHRLAGGQVTTALLACRRLGLSAGYVGTVGDDPAADEILAPLAAAGVEHAAVRRVAGAASRLALILADRESGERTVLWHRDPRLKLEVSQLSSATLLEGRVLLVDAVDPEAATWAARLSRAEGRPVVADVDTPGPGSAALLAAVDFPVVSESFARTVHGGPEAAVAALVRGGARMAAVTLGPQGALGRIGEREIASPAFRVAVRDTTGAGDVFHAGFVAGLLAGLGPTALLRFANAAAALSCTALGSQGGLPTRAAVDALLQSSSSAATTSSSST